MLTRVLIVIDERGHIVFIGWGDMVKLSCSLSDSFFRELRMSKGKREREQRKAEDSGGGCFVVVNRQRCSRRTGWAVVDSYLN